MGRPLSEMSKEELWQLFPIRLTEHQIEWQAQYAEEAARIAPLFPQGTRLHHMGSTAIPAI